MNIKNIIGLTVVAIKGEFDSKGKYIKPKYILFSDGKTYIELEDQDYYTYHDCSPSAKHVNVYVPDTGYSWDHLMTYPDATVDV